MADRTIETGQIAVILVAAGRGNRAGRGLPKQYRMLAGVPMIRRTLEALRRALPAASILPVIHPEDGRLFKEATDGLDGLMSPVFGGDTRQQSVNNALVALKEPGPSVVFIHDAARPFVSAGLINRLLAALEGGATGVVPALPVVDTLLRARPQGRETVDRTDLFAVQTPQAFDYTHIAAAHAAMTENDFTDDASLFEACGGRIEQVMGDERNFKVTGPEDFMKAEQWIMGQFSDVRTGTGYDVHRFEDGDSLWLCGVNIPHRQALKGHSDADVALHALTDAVLAAVADGDIGTHFPPSDDRWRGAPSHSFLSFACERVRQKGGVIGNLAVIIICESPKIGPHAAKMRARIAEICELEVSRVSVQATTTERLGFTGRGEGIAAQATATVRLPVQDGKA